jgi:hypothetical protein
MHPETEVGEVFIANISTVDTRLDPTGTLISDPEISLHENFQQIGHSNKRLGKTSYLENGEIAIDLVPVFVSLSGLSPQLAATLIQKDSQRKYPTPP